MSQAQFTFDPPLELTPAGAKVKIDFRSTDELLAWLERERTAWEPLTGIGASNHSAYANHARMQLQMFADLANNSDRLIKLQEKQYEAMDQHLRRIKETSNQIRAYLNNISTGENVCTDSAFAPRALALLPERPESAALWLWLHSPNVQRSFGQAVGNTPWGDLLIDVMNASVPDDAPSIVTTSRAALEDLRNRSQEELRLLQDLREAEIGKNAAAHKVFDDELLAGKNAATDQLGDIAKAWTALKKLYDTDLALRAPALYWTEKQRRHRVAAVSYGIVFAVFVATALILFVKFGIGILDAAAQAAAQSNSIVPRLTEIAVPAFLGVWVLRIIGRMLATHMQLLEEAGERTTMVKTFLALMKDEERGSLVKDEDRILILSALFRHSSPSGTDDAPPASWFDLLMTRLKGEK